jgi:hypothetical protein
VRVVGQRSARRVPQAPRHAEVDQENPTGFEPNNQILAAAFQRCDALAFELCRHRDRLEGTDQPWVVDVYLLEAPADDVRLERETNGLDLRELWHQLIVSSTIGRAGGASSPNV